MSQPARISYAIVAVLMVLAGYLHLGTFLLTSLFGYLVLQVFNIRRNKWLSVALYLITVAAIGAALVYFSNLAYRTLPRIAEISIPAMVGFAEKNGITLPFTDYASLKSTAMDMAREGFDIIGRYAKVASIQFVLVVAGLVVPLSVFLGSGWTANNGAPAASDNFYFAVTRPKRFGRCNGMAPFERKTASLRVKTAPFCAENGQNSGVYSHHSVNRLKLQPTYSASFTRDL